MVIVQREARHEPQPSDGHFEIPSSATGGTGIMNNRHNDEQGNLIVALYWVVGVSLSAVITIGGIAFIAVYLRELT